MASADNGKCCQSLGTSAWDREAGKETGYQSTGVRSKSNEDKKMESRVKLDARWLARKC